ncbi:MAG TPA: hypothetical protein VF173_23675 [Thermoanaerobaculia bacterium]|nr:hypothetical protein [Thermoanaerobaculia bacterium]
MCSALRRAAITAVVVAFLVPGFLQARSASSPVRHASAIHGVSFDGGFFSTVWNLLANLPAGRGLTTVVVAQDGDGSDNGGHLDPNGLNVATPPPATTPPDNGGHLDPNG